MREKNRAHYEANREERNAANRAYYAANRETLKERNRQRQQRNRKKYAERRRQWWAENKDRINSERREFRSIYTWQSWVNRLRKHGLTPEDYWRILDEQGGCCALCESDDPGKAGNSDARVFAVDHCAKTGAVRGLLCHSCNLGLGKFRDDPEVLIKAAAYVQQCCP